MAFLINYLTRIQFGENAVYELEEEIRQLGVNKPLFVTDKGLSNTKVMDVAVSAGRLKSAPVVFDGTPENPTEGAVEDALTVLRKNECDGVVAVGGGSSIDLAKGIALLATHPGPLRQYAAVQGGIEKIRADILPLIAIPTTAGTGSEVGRASLITMRDKRKLGLVSPFLIPSVAICDPALTLSLPPLLTAATGMDAVAHCVETFLSPQENPPADAIALDGLGRAVKNIHEAVSNGKNMEARTQMMMAALEGAMAFQKGLGAVHSLSHALGGFHELNLHHGTLNALFMPAVLRFNASHCKGKYQRIAQVMALDAGAELANEFEQLNHSLGLPSRLHAFGVKEDLFEQVSEWAFHDHSTATNPKPARKDDFYKMLVETR